MKKKWDKKRVNKQKHITLLKENSTTSTIVLLESPLS